MHKKLTPEQGLSEESLENSFAEMASTLDLESQDTVAPWGFVAVAAYTPEAADSAAEAASHGEISSSEAAAIWKVVETYHNLASSVEIKNDTELDAAIGKITAGIKTCTTNPFYCVLPNNTYPVLHASLKSEVTSVFQRFFDAKLYKPRSTVQILPRATPWLVGPDIVSVQYRTRAGDDASEKLASNSTAILFNIDGTWMLNLLSSDVYEINQSSGDSG